MTRLITIIVFFFLCSPVFSTETGSFFYGHTKGRACVDSWLLMERLIQQEKVRCNGLIPLEGFPYLRGPKSLLELSNKISTKYSGHEWLELLRRVDLQARYMEVDALSRKARQRLCKKAGIDCFWGRIRAYIARCSAMLMGDEKINNDYMERVKTSAQRSILKNTGGTMACFEDVETLDGFLGDDVITGGFSPPRGKTGASVLKRRVDSMKALTPKRYR